MEMESERQTKASRQALHRQILVDRCMGRGILVGGLGVLSLVAAIFLFIVIEILPLFRGARVGDVETRPTGVSDPIVLGVDDWNQRPFIIGRDGGATLLSTREDGETVSFDAPFTGESQIRKARYIQERQLVLAVLEDGRFFQASLEFTPNFNEGGERTVTGRITWQAKRLIHFPLSGKILDFDYLLTADREILACLYKDEDDLRLVVQKRPRGDTASGYAERAETATMEAPDQAERLLLGPGGAHLLVATSGSLHAYGKFDGTWQPFQVWAPFPAGETVADMAFALGRERLSVLGSHGSHRLFHPAWKGDGPVRRYVPSGALAKIPGDPLGQVASLNNKAMLVFTREALSLRYLTTSQVRWEKRLIDEVSLARLGSTYKDIYLIGKTGMLQHIPLHDPHPEASLKAFFGRIIYEGHDQPRHLWQSTGGTDAYEAKLSLIPLIAGTLKGTMVALLFSVPLALMAAVYTSQYLHPNLRRWIKPVIEIMASLPSVVLGFLAALWLAPRLAAHMPSVFLILLSLPLSAMALSSLWGAIPWRWRAKVPAGWEGLLVMPVIAAVGLLAWEMGPLLEAVAFRFTDPVSGETSGDFRLWWEAFSGQQFQQRNALVVGFMMGFAVIPIIFTLTEDALHAVPRSLVSGSLALGASRWQTTTHIILPSAAPGIFSAIMIGFGRAAGETMILIMATGNTPLMDGNLFTGMRTLSANLALELPEAPYASTLYRTLFLGAFLLFLMTFLVNTLAEVLRSRLRRHTTPMH